MSLSHAKGLPLNQHRVLADGTPGRLAAPAHQCTECSLCTVVTSRTILPLDAPNGGGDAHLGLAKR